VPVISSINVAIVEDNLEMSLSLVELLEAVSDIEVVATFGDGEEAIDQIGQSVPDVVLMDIHLPGMSGIECVRRLKASHPDVGVMMFTAFEDSDDLFASLSAGANGYLLKRARPAAVIDAIRELHAGGSPMSPAIARRLVHYFQKPAPTVAVKNTLHSTSPHQTALSAREQEVIKMLADGQRYKEIAVNLNLAVTTVRTHLGRIYEKLHVSSRTEAVVKYLNAEA